MSWVGEEAFEIDGRIRDGYIFDNNEDLSGQTDLWWNVTDENDYNRHSFIDLKVMEVK